MHGLESAAGKQAVKLILEHRHMSRMMGAPLKKSALLLGDNNSVVLNTTVPSSVLKKKHCVMSCHKIRETIAAGIVKFLHIKPENNCADTLAKPLPPKAFRSLADPLLFRNPPNKQFICSPLEGTQSQEHLFCNKRKGLDYNQANPTNS